MFKALKSFVVVVALSIASTTTAEVVLDGTLGLKGALLGPDFAIKASFGEQKDNNLFHSFSIFNLNSTETANFLGSNNIENIISRVTGGNPSDIDGTLNSTIPNADFYFLNPAGIIFGPNAQLDVQGSLYISTANYLRLGNTGRFDASHPKQSLLTTASPSAFGFLDTSLVSISNDGGLLKLNEGKTLSFIGGDLNFHNGHVKVPNGHINLIRIASSGELPFQIDDFHKRYISFQTTL